MPNLEFKHGVEFVGCTLVPSGLRRVEFKSMDTFSTHMVVASCVIDARGFNYSGRLPIRGRGDHQYEPEQLPSLLQELDAAACLFVVVGGGKTGMDAAQYILTRTSPGAEICVITGRPKYFVNRDRFFQRDRSAEDHPCLSQFSIEMLLEYDGHNAAALYARAASTGHILQVGASQPTSFVMGIISQEETVLLRENVQFVEDDYFACLEGNQVVLRSGRTIKTSKRIVVVNCTSSFQPDQPPFGHESWVHPIRQDGTVVPGALCGQTGGSSYLITKLLLQRGEAALRDTVFMGPSVNEEATRDLNYSMRAGSCHIVNMIQVQSQIKLRDGEFTLNFDSWQPEVTQKGLTTLLLQNIGKLKSKCRMFCVQLHPVAEALLGHCSPQLHPDYVISDREEVSLTVELVSRILADFLPPPQLDANLLDAGLDSRQGLTFVSALRKHTDVELSSAVLFQYPSIRAIAGYLDGGTMASKASTGGVCTPTLATQDHEPYFGSCLPASDGRQDSSITIGGTRPTDVDVDTAHFPDSTEHRKSPSLAAVVSTAEELDNPIHVQSLPISPEMIPKTHQMHTNTGVCLSINVIGMACHLQPGINTPDHLWKVLSSQRCVIPSNTQDSKPVQSSEDTASYIPKHVRSMAKCVLSAANDALLQLSQARLGLFACSPSLNSACPARLVCEELRVNLALCKSFDALSSSGHLALHEASTLLTTNEDVDTIIVVGGNPAYNDPLSSPDGVARAFDVQANGVVGSEGYAAVVLQQGVATRSLCSIIGSAVTYNSPETPPGWPDQAAEERAIQEALQAAKVRADQISFVEMVANGALVGDDAEVHAVASVLGGHGVALGGFNANLGHPTYCCGLVSLIKAVVQLEERAVAPHIHLENPIGPIAKGQLLAPTAGMHRLPGGGQLVAGIHGHATSGVNVHLVIASPDLVALGSAATRTVHTGVANKQPVSPGGWFQGSPPLKKATHFQDSIALCKAELHAMYQELLLSNTTRDEVRDPLCKVRPSTTRSEVKAAADSRGEKLAGKITRLENALERMLVTTVKPVLTRSDYSTVPPISQLQAMTHVELRRVEGFKIVREGAGQIEWDGAVDLRGADLDQAVVIERGSVEVYPAGSAPARGRLLNRPAVVTLTGIFGRGEEQVHPDTAESVFYDPETGVVKFQVQHFSRYTLPSFPSVQHGVQMEPDQQTELDTDTLRSYSSSELADWVRQDSLTLNPVKTELLANTIEAENITGRQFVEDSVALADRLAEGSGMDDSDRFALLAALPQARPTVPPQREATTSAIACNSLRETEAWVLQEAQQILGCEKVLSDENLMEIYGMTSAQAIRLKRAIEMATGLRLAGDFLFEHGTVASIAGALLERPDGPAPQEDPLPHVEAADKTITDPSGQLPAWARHIVQLFGSFGVLLLASAALLPPYHYGVVVQYGDCETEYAALTDQDGCLWLGEPWSHIALNGEYRLPGLLMPVVIPLWMLSFSLLVICAKWLLIGKYQEGVLRMYSCAFVWWWFIDRLVDFWEKWVGHLLLDTIALKMNYKVMGAEVAWNSDLCMIREFDLLKVGSASDCSAGSVLMRMVETGRLRLRHVTIEDGCKLGKLAIVMPGCLLANACIMHPTSVALEGSVIDADCSGNPARLTGSQEGSNDSKPTDWVLMLVRESTLGLLLYWLVFASRILVTILFTRSPLPEDFRYTPLLFWITTYFFAGFVQVLSCLVLKWLLLGQQKPGVYKTARHVTWREWLVDYLADLAHYTTLKILVEEVMYPNFWGQCLGGHIAPTAGMNSWDLLPPSKADLVHIGDRVVVSGTFFITEEDIRGEPGFKLRSSVLIESFAILAFNAVVGPDVSIGPHSKVGIRTWVAHTQLEPGSSAVGGTVFRVTREYAYMGHTNFMKGLCTFTGRLFTVGVVLCSLIPAYEVAIQLFYGQAYYRNLNTLINGYRIPIDRNAALLLFSGVLVVQFLSFTIFLHMFSLFVFRGCISMRDSLQPVVSWMYNTHQVMNSVLFSLIISPLQGTIWAVFLLRLLGSEVKKSVFVNSWFLREPFLWHIAEGCILDTALVLGHTWGETGTLYFGPMCLGQGVILMPHSIVWAGDIIPSQTSIGPGTKTLADDLVQRQYWQGVPATEISALLNNQQPGRQQRGENARP